MLCNWPKSFDRECFSTESPRLDEYIERVATIPGVTDYILHHQEATTWIPAPGPGVALTTPEELVGPTSVR